MNGDLFRSTDCSRLTCHADPIMKNRRRLQAACCWLAASWGNVLHIAFLILCLRFLVAALWSEYAYTEGWTTLVLITGSIVLGAWNTTAALFALVAAVPLLNGLGYVGLEGLVSPPCTVLAAFFLGDAGRRIALRATRFRSQAWKVTAMRRNRELAGQSGSWPIQLVTDLLITVILASLGVQALRQHGMAGLGTRIWRQPVFGYADPLYFITSGFVWLEGLFFFRLLCVKGERREMKNEDQPAADIGLKVNGEIVGAKSNKGDERAGGAEAAWVWPVFVVHGISLGVFFAIQAAFHTPEINQTAAPNRFFSPFEDLHSFGGFAVVALIFFVATWRWKSCPQAVIYGLWTLGIFALVVLSWSRATWLAGALSMLLMAWLRLPRGWTIVSLTLLALAVAFTNANAMRGPWMRNAYFSRLASLTRLESPRKKDPGRIYLYQKALGMIAERPWRGHGIGSFFLTSVQFAQPSDFYGRVPSFAHNFLLQLAAEVGLPTTTVFIALIGYALWRGFRLWCGHDGESVKGSAGRNSGEGESEWVGMRGAGAGTAGRHDSGAEKRLAMLGVTLALTAYLITQMTANALNIYITNQFLFWFLMAVLLTARSEREAATAD